jgi:hypothetical protein
VIWNHRKLQGAANSGQEFTAVLAPGWRFDTPFETKHSERFAQIPEMKAAVKAARRCYCPQCARRV